jgi:nicotinamide-nucleotide amidase
MFSSELENSARALLVRCSDAGLLLASAESCTGGLIAGLLTSVAGSSAVVERGFVTYSNEAKTEMLGVPAALIARHGAVSQEVAQAMVLGVLERAPVDLAVSVTGVAGPGGGSAEKPVGLVFIGVCRRGAAPTVTRNLFTGDRQAIRLASVGKALSLLDGLIR